MTFAHTHASTRQVSGIPRRAAPHALGLATDAPAQYVVAAGTIQTVVRARGMARGTAADGATCEINAGPSGKPCAQGFSDVVAGEGWRLAGEGGNWWGVGRGPGNVCERGTYCMISTGFHLLAVVQYHQARGQQHGDTGQQSQPIRACELPEVAVPFQRPRICTNATTLPEAAGFRGSPRLQPDGVAWD